MWNPVCLFPLSFQKSLFCKVLPFTLTDDLRTVSTKMSPLLTAPCGRCWRHRREEDRTRQIYSSARPTFPIAHFPHFQRKKNNTSQFFYRKVYIDCTIYRYAIVSPIQGQYLLITPMLTNSLICLGSQSQWDMLMSCLNKLFLNGTEARGACFWIVVVHMYNDTC